MNMLLVSIIAFVSIYSASAKRLRGAQPFIPATKHDTNVGDVDKRQLLENIDKYLFDVDQYKANYGDQDIAILDVVDMIETPTNKVELNVYNLPETYGNDDYIGQLEGLLPTLTKYHNDHFFLSMDIREHRYEEVTLDIFGYVHNVNLQSNDISETKSPEVDSNDLFYRKDTRSVVGLMGLLPGYHHLNSMANEFIESKAPYDSTSVLLDILKKSAPVLNKFSSEAFDEISSKRYHWVGMLHGLLPGGTDYHNDDFFLSFASIEDQHHESIPHNFVDIIDMVATGDRVDSKAYQPLVLDGADGKVILGLLGLLPGATKIVDHFRIGDLMYEAIKLQQFSVSSPMLDVLGIVADDKVVNPEAYKSTHTVLNDGDYVGQLHGLLPDIDKKMKYLEYGWDELTDNEVPDSNSVSIDMLNLITGSQSSGVTMNAPQSGHDVSAILMTNPPTEAPTSYPSAFPSATLSPSMTHEQYIVAQVDFSNAKARSNSHFVLNNGAEIIPAPGLVSNALRIDRDGPYATIPGVNIGPSEMPDCTLMIGLYLDSIANGFGWVFGHEESGYDRTILMHDYRFGGGIASAIGYSWNPWTETKPHVPTKQWVHITAVFRQGGESYVFLNGVKSDNTAIGKNDDGKGELWIGRPRWGGHWTDSWIKEVKVFNTALDDSLVKNYANEFIQGVTHVPVVCGSSYGDCKGNSASLTNINTSAHAVRCCSDFGRPGWQQNSNCNIWAKSELDGLCYESETYVSAHELCSSQSARLCTQSELERDCAAGSGCELDHHMTWTTPAESGVESTS